jgi:hypothetical protein
VTGTGSRCYTNSVELDESYRLLEVNPAVTDAELKSAHRDLTKVWHPDRFAHDPVMQRKAQEKLKAINEAYDTIRAARAGEPRPSPPSPPARRSGPRTYQAWAYACAFAGVVILVRRPTPGGLLFALALFAAAVYFIVRMRESVR